MVWRVPRLALSLSCVCVYALNTTCSNRDDDLDERDPRMTKVMIMMKNTPLVSFLYVPYLSQEGR